MRTKDKITFSIFFFSLSVVFSFFIYRDHMPAIFGQTSRNPTSVSEAKIDEILRELYHGVEQGVDSSSQCYSELEVIYSKLFYLSAIDSGALELTKEELKDLVETSFLTRVEIKEKLKALRLTNIDDQRCLSAVKDIYRGMRYVEDYLLEMVYPLAQVEDFATFETPGVHFQINPKFQDEFKSFRDLKSGDIILSRGGAYSSAAIARVGLDDTQFSHLILVYVDPKTKKVSTVEAHIEVGSLILDLKDVLDERHARAVLFRHPDSELAHRAAKIMFEKVGAAERSGERIPYDFGMNYQNHDEIFCSEVIYMGYKIASENKFEFPEHKTKFHPGLVSFLNILGIKVDDQSVHTFLTFAPGDMQFDPSFDLVAEYRHPAKLRDSREKDMILTKIFDWMVAQDYKFQPTFDIKAKSTAAYLARRTPILRKKLEDKFPLNMPKELLRLFMTLDEVGAVLHERISFHQKKHEYPLTPLEIFNLLEEYRQEDEKRFVRSEEIKKEIDQLSSFGHEISPLDRRHRNLMKEREKIRPHFHQWFRK